MTCCLFGPRAEGAAVGRRGRSGRSARIIGVEILKATFNTATTCTSGDNGGEDTAMQ